MPEVPKGWMSIAESCARVLETPKEFSIPVALHESGWGTSPPVMTHRNCFGIMQDYSLQRFSSLTVAWEAFAWRFKGEHSSYRKAAAIYDRDGGLSHAFVVEFASAYCPNTTTHPRQSDDWVKDVEALIVQLFGSEALLS